MQSLQKSTKSISYIPKNIFLLNYYISTQHSGLKSVKKIKFLHVTERSQMSENPEQCQVDRSSPKQGWMKPNILVFLRGILISGIGTKRNETIWRRRIKKRKTIFTAEKIKDKTYNKNYTTKKLMCCLSVGFVWNDKRQPCRPGR